MCYFYFFRYVSMFHVSLLFYRFFMFCSFLRVQAYYTNNLSSDDDDYFQPDIFAPYTQDYRTQKPRQTQTSQNVKIYPQNPADIQSYQPLQMQNPITIQSYQPAQSQNPANMRSYQATQMQNEILLPYYLQQHEITKNQLTNFLTDTKCR